MKTPFAAHASRLGTRSSLLLALAATVLVGCGGKGQPSSGSTTAPTITSQPRSVGVDVGGSATFSVSASGSNLTYQWYRGTSAISGATKATFTINPVSTADYASNYSVIVTNDKDSTRSDYIKLTAPVTGAPTITDQPTSIGAPSGSAATFHVTATGTGTLTYQWYRNGTAVVGATSEDYTIDPVSSANVGSYYVIITNDKGSTTSATVNLSIVAPAAPTITTQPITKTVPAGNSASFSVVATGSPTLTYQWFKDSVAIPGATSSTYAITSASSSDVGSYYVIVTNSLGSAQSSTATFSLAAAPSITAEPADVTANQGSTATFTVAATGTPTLKYQWYKGPTKIDGAQSSTYTISNVTSGSAGQYRVIVTNDYGTDTSRTATLTVIGPPTITTQPASTTVGVGSTATFTVVATGTGSLTYKWYKNGTEISGATGTSYTTPATVAGDSGATFYVKVTNAAGTTQSATATLKVDQPPTIVTQPASLTVNVGQTATFSVVATVPTGGSLSYQWKKNGAPISGATASSYTTPATVAGDTNTTYSVVVYNDMLLDASVTSNNATLTVTGG